MFKNILKEISITLLLLIAIVLLLGIVFYDYVPFNKVVPAKVEAYTLAEDIKDELNKELKEAENITKTYSIDASTLDQYEYAKEYNSGKINPFSTVKVQPTTENNNNTNNNQTTSSTTINSSTGTFFNDVGK